MKTRHLIYLFLLTGGLVNMQSGSAYRFLGKMTGYTAVSGGLVAYCEDGMQVEIRFLTAEIFRVILQNGMSPQEPLDEVFVNGGDSSVVLDIQDFEQHLLLSSAALDVQINRDPLRLTVLNKQGRIINRDEPGLGIGWDGNEVRCWKSLLPDEKFFGLGEKTGALNKRGREWVMWNSDRPGYGDATDPLYQSVPFYIGLNDAGAYGIFLNNSHRSIFNLGAGNGRFASFGADGGLLDYVFIAGPQIREVVSRYTGLSGRMPLPPVWALGYQQCRWSYYPDSTVLSLARTFREKQIPADVIYLDIHYMDAYRVFSWDSGCFPDPAGMLQQLRELGFRVVTIIDPGVKADPDYPVAKQGLAEGHFLKYPDGEVYTGEVWPGKSYFPDFSRPETRLWWGNWLQGMLDTGVAGFWNDMNEPAVWGVAFPNEVVADDGGRGSNFKKMHNLYASQMARATYDAARENRPEQRPFVLTRAGFAGEQRYSAVWTGDNGSSWEHLALGIRMMLGLGLSGIAFNGSDVGGFDGTPSPELYARWIQLGTFSPLFRTHTRHNSPAQEPWSFGEEVEQISRAAIGQRYRYLPYLYTLFWEASESGAPLMRPLCWEFQEDPQVYDARWQHQFMVGSHLLAAPVVQEGERLKQVYLPAGEWLDFNSEKQYAGGQVVVVEAPLDRLPLFLRAGAILPSQPLRQHTGEAPAACLIFDLFPGNAYGQWLHYEDDGSSFAYEQGAWRLTQVESLPLDNGLSIGIRRTADGYARGERLLELRIHAFSAAPKEVRLGKRKLPLLEEGAFYGYRYNPEQRLLTVVLEDAPQALEVRIKQ